MENDAEVPIHEPEKSFEFKVRPAVFSFIAERIRPEVNKRFEDVKQLDGSYKAVADFWRTDPVAVLLTQMIEQYPQSGDTFPPSPTLNITKSQLELIKQTIPQSDNPAEGKLRRENLGELESAFRDARTEARIKEVGSKVVNFLKGKRK